MATKAPEEANGTAKEAPITVQAADVPKPDATPQDSRDVLDILEAEGKEWEKDAEIKRILAAFRLDAYSVLGLQPGVPSSEIKLLYRKKSLLIHPDKTKNPLAPEAFDRLKKASVELADEKHRASLDEAIADARMLLIREHAKEGWTVDSPELRTEEFKKVWAEKTKSVLMENEMRRRRQLKGQMQDEGRQQRKEEEEVEERKRKRQHEQDWEATREQRIGSWREFQKGGVRADGVNGGGGEGGKKKKKKMKPIG